MNTTARPSFKLWQAGAGGGGEQDPPRNPPNKHLHVQAEHHVGAARQGLLHLRLPAARGREYGSGAPFPGNRPAFPGRQQPKRGPAR